MRADRLLQILLTLQHMQKITAKQLAEQLEVSERTVHRDMEALSAMGIPVIADRGTGGGWSLLAGYRSALTGMNRGDIEALLLPQLTAGGHHPDWTAAFARASGKLLAALPPDWRRQAEEVRRRIHIDGAGWHSDGREGEETSTVLPTLQEALWAGRKLAFTYLRDQSAAELTVSPYGLVNKRTVWYLVAMPEQPGCAALYADLARTYRVSRIRTARMLDEPAEELDGPFDLAAHWSASVTKFKEQLPVYRAVILANQEDLTQLKNTRYLHLEQIEQTLQGPVRIHARFDTLESAVSIVLGFAGQVTVLEPAELRTGVHDAACSICQAHDS
ncbi:MAG: YafY family transcriptional regulator [Paenibacillaceae bacterium]|jgi:predicted DNA-binding transcriptional regulator YafY|nr:YafY family transcriptional regulator [Paenibacillaceae bacterium]